MKKNLLLCLLVCSQATIESGVPGRIIKVINKTEMPVEIYCNTEKPKKLLPDEATEIRQSWTSIKPVTVTGIARKGTNIVAVSIAFFEGLTRDLGSPQVQVEHKITPASLIH